MSKPHNPPMYTKHWFRFLSDAGRPIERAADDLDSIAARIKDLRQQIADLGTEYKRIEAEFMPLVEDNWGAREIDETMKQGIV